MIGPRKSGGGWKILLLVRAPAIYGMHAATLLNPRTFPAVFVDSMPNHSKQGVRDTELEVLDDLHVVRRDNDADVAEPGHLAPIKAGQPYAESIRFPCHLKGEQDIGRASAPAYPKRNIAGLNEVAQ